MRLVVTLRARIAITAAAAVAVAFLLAGLGLYLATERTLRREMDESLSRVAVEMQRGRPGRAARSLAGPLRGGLAGPAGFVQVVDVDGRTLGPNRREAVLPHGPQEAEVAAGRRDPFYRTVAVQDMPVRVLTVPLNAGLAAQIARPLNEVEAALAALRTRLALGGLAATALAVGLGVLVARGAVRPVERLTAVAENVAATGDLSRRIDLPAGHDDRPADELTRLATTFNAMLANLEQARQAQEQLVVDASHELRTPLTSLRTNIEVLTTDASGAARASGASDGSAATDASNRAPGQLDPEDRRQLLADLTVQLDEFGRLVGALVELARGARPPTVPVPLRLDELVGDAVDRARAFAGPDQRIELDATPVKVLGAADRLDRAVANLLDNAIKYGEGQPIDVRVTARERAVVVTVRDRGVGITDEDRPRIFERFFRGPRTRDLPGSGLGLSIVAQVAAAHGGTVDATAAPGTGTTMTLTLPIAPPDAPAPERAG